MNFLKFLARIHPNISQVFFYESKSDILGSKSKAKKTSKKSTEEITQFEI